MQEVVFQREVIIDKVSGDVVGYQKGEKTIQDGEQAWHSDDATWKEITSPDLSEKGYCIPNISSVEAKTVLPSFEAQAIQVQYKPFNKTILPSTGGIGALSFYISGLLMVIGGWFGFRKKSDK